MHSIRQKCTFEFCYTQGLIATRILRGVKRADQSRHFHADRYEREILNQLEMEGALVCSYEHPIALIIRPKLGKSS